MGKVAHFDGSIALILRLVTIQVCDLRNAVYSSVVIWGWLSIMTDSVVLILRLFTIQVWNVS
jgi:hypothetical protein